MKRVFDYNPMYDILQVWHYDEATDRATIETIQGHEAVAEQCTAMRNQTTKHTPYNDGAHHVARIPLVILNDLMAKGITRDKKKFKQWLNDPDNRVFRTREGTV